MPLAIQKTAHRVNAPYVNRFLIALFSPCLFSVFIKSRHFTKQNDSLCIYVSKFLRKVSQEATRQKLSTRKFAAADC